MNEKNYKGIDLNLLLVFAVLMRERSTTGAAKCLCLSQSAVSQNLRRLRDITNDELFVRARGGITPTSRALALYRDILPSLDNIEQAMKNRDSFVPANTTRHFKVRLMGIESIMLAPALLERVQAQAPNLTISISSGGPPCDPISFLEEDGFDLAVAATMPGRVTHSWQRSADLPEEPIVCIYDGERLNLPCPITLEDYIKTPHIMPFLDTQRLTMVDDALSAVNLTRFRAIYSDDHAGMPFYLQKTRAIANFPLRTAKMVADTCGLAMSPLPLEVEPYRTTVYWHARNDADLGHIWLRSLVTEAAVNIGAEPAISSPSIVPRSGTTQVRQKQREFS